MKKLLIVFCIVSILASCNKEKDSTIDGNLTVSGYLTNGTSPVANATVDIDNLIQHQVTSNTEGFFEIKNVAKGAHTLNYKVGSDEGSFSKITESIEVNGDLLLESLLLPEPVILNEPTIQRSINSNEVTLSWEKYTGDDFREYKLYKHSSSGLDETTGELLHVATTANDTVFATTLPHSSETYFRVFVRDNFGLLGGSNIVEADIGVYEPDPLIEVGVQTDYYLSSGEQHNLYFETQEAGFYSVAWFDAWFENYSPGIVVVSASNFDSSKYYFQGERLIQNNGSPFPIYVPKGERVNLNIKNYLDRFPGPYGIKINHLSVENGTALEIGTPINTLMNLGDVKLLYVDVIGGKEYEIVVGNNVDGGAFDDGATTHLSIFEEGSDDFSIYKTIIPSPCCGSTETFPISVDTSKRIYLTINAAYWFKANMVNIVVNEL